MQPAVAFTVVLQAQSSLNLFSCLYMPIIMPSLTDIKYKDAPRCSSPYKGCASQGTSRGNATVPLLSSLGMPHIPSTLPAPCEPRTRSFLNDEWAMELPRYSQSS